MIERWIGSLWVHRAHGAYALVTSCEGAVVCMVLHTAHMSLYYTGISRVYLEWNYERLA